MPSKERYVKAARRAERMAAAKAYMEAHYLDTSLHDLAAHLGVCVNTVSRWARKWELGGKHLSRTQKDHIARVYPDGTEEQVQRIADNIGMSRATLRKMAHTLGVRRSADAISRQKSIDNSGPRQRYSEANAKRAQAYRRRKGQPSEPPKEQQPDFIPYTRWMHRHDEEMRRDYPDRPTADMAEEQGVNYYTVSRRAARLGVGKSEAFMHTAFKKGAKGGWKVKGEARAKYKANADEYMKAHFATTKNDELAATLGTDPKTIRRWARRLGLVKSDEFMREARSRGLAKSHKIHQGYYTPEHLAWRLQRIRDVYPDGDAEQIEALCEELGCSRGWLEKLAHDAGIRRTKEAWSRASKEGQLKSGRTKYTPDILAEIAAYYPDHTKQEIAQRFGISPGVIGQLAVQHGWRKSREHIRRIRSEINRAWHERKKD